MGALWSASGIKTRVTKRCCIKQKLILTYATRFTLIRCTWLVHFAHHLALLRFRVRRSSLGELELLSSWEFLTSPLNYSWVNRCLKEKVSNFARIFVITPVARIYVFFGVNDQMTSHTTFRVDSIFITWCGIEWVEARTRVECYLRKRQQAGSPETFDENPIKRAAMRNLIDFFGDITRTRPEIHTDTRKLSLGFISISIRCFIEFVSTYIALYTTGLCTEIRW